MNELLDPDLKRPREYPTDEHGLPGTTQGDGSYGGGDTASQLGLLITLCPDDEKFFRWASKLEHIWDSENQVPVRHPDKTKPFGRPNRFSRDQLIGILCASARIANVLNYPNIITNNIFKAHKKKWFLRAWNTERNGDGALPHPGGADFTGPQIWGLWLRIYRPWWRHLILWFCDLENFIGALIWQYKTRTESLEVLRKYRITCNHMAVAITAKKYSPTIISRLTYKITPFAPMILRWDAHCRKVREYSTAELFEEAIKNVSL